ncbi:MAG TPA: zinc ABC transporter substrate-binding protein [Bacteroidales bacterium]|jgi:zinc transport system substrate-binding protein|nr:zinc ABC transporter substrate-binding protein [Bacteroidales bacterium]
MKRFCFLLAIVLVLVSCSRKIEPDSRIISVSIAPFRYFVDEISGGRFSVNVMVPPGSNPHVYEPIPEQITRLGKSVAYISDGYLGFEMAWLDRFYEINRTMEKLSLSGSIDPILSEGHHHDDSHSEGADPHYWVSPRCAARMALSVRDFLTRLDPGKGDLFNENYKKLLIKISELDSMASELSSHSGKKAFMIYHPNLAYLARDYGLEEITVEADGKEPSPSRLVELIRRARADSIKVIMVQREYDTKNARAVADEAGARIVVIDPLSEDWYSSTAGIIKTIKESFE